ncbi:MAG TPA: peptidase [Trebonia sp.]|nr:peptidase [Trebonia sp.]
MRRALGSLAVLLAAGMTLAAPAALASTDEPVARAGPWLPAPAAPAGSFGIRLVDVPVSEAPDSRAWSYIIDSLHPGTVIHRRVAVQNMTSVPARISVYADAASITGGAFIGAAGQTRSDLTSWTSVGQPVLNLAPGASAMDMVTIAVPADATAGERYGVIWAQETARVKQGQQFAINEVNRVGVRVYLNVGPGGPPPVSFSITSLTAGHTAAGAPQVVARVRDTGQRAVDLSGTLKLSGGPGGSSAGPFQFGSNLTLAPGQSGLMRAVLSKSTPPGSWRVSVALKSDTTTRQAAATLTLGGLAAAGYSFPARSVVGGGIGAVVLLLATWLLARRFGWRVRGRRI